MNLLGYVRVSTEEQARDGISLGQQVARIEAYCALHGHVLLQVVADEGVSASVALAKREGGRAVLQALKTGTADGVVVVRLDRLFRDALDGLAFFRGTAERHGAAVHSVSELIDTSTPAGKLALTIQLAAAQYERDLAVLRATECNGSLREQGRVYGGIPYGCVAVGKGDERRLYRDAETWKWRALIVSELRSGQFSLRELAAHLADLGVPSPTGKKQWSPNTLREMPLHHDSLSDLPMHASALPEQRPHGAQCAVSDSAGNEAGVSTHA
ncbi:recombinase family protein [Dyella amyloliquefaciens]|uniref:recombinase family protein n=1 Tax=Dyella amyloliquefaciens TaxID=1770545 RepID=UPI00102E95EE|nr:recombinase family protein [Dyella amyloliquefaciens]